MELIGTISVYSSIIEFKIERTIWNINNIAVEGVRPKTDGKPISKLIEYLEESKEKSYCRGVNIFISDWTKIADSSYKLRNIIIHGFPVSLGNSLLICNNTSIDGEVRKKAYNELWTDQNTLTMIEYSFAVLARSIYFLEKITKGKKTIEESHEFTTEFKESSSKLLELEHLAEFVESEKY